MADIFEIAGRIHSTSQEGVATVASEILDETQNKKQSEVNVDVARHENEIHGTGGIDSRLSDVEQMEQIVIDGGDAQIATGADFTNPDATKRAKIPTVGAIVDGLNDGVYDVSKRNPTGGPNSDGKFTLDYILSNANTLIPTGWRHGGMTISFVDSSDNKYIQARCTANEFTTDITKWQGVDDEPTANSENLVKSGGIFESIQNAALRGSLVGGNGQVRTDVEGLIPGQFYKLVIDRDGWDVTGFDGTIQALKFRSYNSNDVITNLLTINEAVFTCNSKALWPYEFLFKVPEDSVKISFFHYSANTVHYTIVPVYDIQVSAPASSNVLLGKSYIYTGALYDNKYCICSKEAVPAVGGTEIRWYIGDNSLIQTVKTCCLIQYDSSMNVVQYHTANALYRDITLDSNTAFINASFVEGTTNLGVFKKSDGTPIFVPSVGFSEQSQINENLKTLQTNINSVSTSLTDLSIKYEKVINGLIECKGYDNISACYAQLYNLLPGRKYKIKIDLKSWSLSSLPSTDTEILKLVVLKAAGGTLTPLRVSSGNNKSNNDIRIVSEYIVTIPDVAVNYCRLYVQADNETTVKYSVEPYDVFDYIHNEDSNVYIGYTYNNYGVLTKNDDFVCTRDLTPVTGGRTVLWCYGLTDLGIGCSLVYYDSNGDFITSNGAQSNKKYRTITLREDVAFVKVSFKNFVNGAGLYYVENDGTCTEIVKPRPIGLQEQLINGLNSMYSDKIEPYTSTADIVKYWNTPEKEVIKNNMMFNSSFNALFFSDLHANKPEYQRIAQLANNWVGDIDCIFDGGDFVGSVLNETQLNSLAQVSSTILSPLLRAVGNHDAWITNTWNWATLEQIYTYITAPCIALLNQKSGITVVQPSDAATAFRNYYYVEKGNFRIIVLVSMNFSEMFEPSDPRYLATDKFYDSAQDIWFENVLADAKANNKFVICVNHCPFAPDSCEAIECNWSSVNNPWGSGTDYTHLDNAALNRVDSFISAGGKFVCWLCGHHHSDHILKTTETTNTQICFVTNLAGTYILDSANKPTDTNNFAFDLFNMVSIDTTHDYLKLWRIGLNMNGALQSHNTLCMNYKTGKVISET